VPTSQPDLLVASKNLITFCLLFRPPLLPLYKFAMLPLLMRSPHLYSCFFASLHVSTKQRLNQCRFACSPYTRNRILTTYFFETILEMITYVRPHRIDHANERSSIQELARSIYICFLNSWLLRKRIADLSCNRVIIYGCESCALDALDFNYHRTVGSLQDLLPLVNLNDLSSTLVVIVTTDVSNTMSSEMPGDLPSKVQIADAASRRIETRLLWMLWTHCPMCFPL